MAVDILQETHAGPQPPRVEPRANAGSFRRRRWKRGWVVIGAVAVIVPAAMLVPGPSSPRQLGPKLTHTITRGDLLVTVREQGTLESSDNTEIKCKVRGQNTVIWVVESGTVVKPGDELVRLDTLFIEEQISERSKYAHWSRSAAERSTADVVAAELAIEEYLQGRYVSQLKTLQKDLAIAESNLRTAKNMLDHAEMMAERGYVSELEVEEKRFAVTQAKLDVEVKETEIDVLKRFTKAEQLETLKGNLAADKARNAADIERAYADAHRRDRALEELEHCVVSAERGGLVIYPSAAEWKNTPDIEEGATVHKDQVLLLMPDLSKMQVKIGIHESIIGRIKPGLATRVTLPDRTLDGEVSSVASVTRPAGWWTGNVVKYDTIVRLPQAEDLKPGMSAEVEVIMARYDSVLTIPVAAVVEMEGGYACWVSTPEGPQRRTLELGDSNDVFMVVQAGLEEGEQVVLNPLAFVDEAQDEALKIADQAAPSESARSQLDAATNRPEAALGDAAGETKRQQDAAP